MGRALDLIGQVVVAAVVEHHVDSVRNELLYKPRLHCDFIWRIERDSQKSIASTNTLDRICNIAAASRPAQQVVSEDLVTIVLVAVDERAEPCPLTARVF